MNRPDVLTREGTSPTYIDDFFRRRDEDPSFVFAEFGHGSTPVAFIQPVAFTGNRAGIGIETWFRDMYGTSKKVVQELRDDDQLDQNIFFIDHNLGGAVIFQKLGAVSFYEGEYDIETRLPDGAVKETFASNVFGDEHQAEFPDRTAKLLEEMSRVTDPDGYVVIRETIKPRYNQSLGRELFDQAGLQLEATITPDDPDWPRLEAIYDADPAHNAIPRNSFYLFLRKQ